MTCAAKYDASYETLGNLDFDYTLGGAKATEYWRWVDIGNAVSGVESKIGNDTYTRESFSSAPDYVLVTHIAGTRPGGVNFTLKLSRIAHATTQVVGQDTLIMTGNTDYKNLKGNCNYEAQVRVVTKGGSVTAQENHLIIANTDEATVLLAAGATYVLEVIWDLFTNTTAASKVIGIDDDFRKQLQDAKDTIRPLEIGKAGQLEEWGHGWDENGDLHHRHVSHLFAALPGCSVTNFTQT